MERYETSSSGNRRQNNSQDMCNEELLRAKAILLPELLEAVLRHLEPRDRSFAAQFSNFSMY